MELKFKKLHENAVLPKHSTHGDAGMDLTAVEVAIIGYGKIQHKYGVAVEIPEGNVGLIFPRSSIHRQAERLSNSVGVIDSGYRGELMAIFDQSKFSHTTYKPGERSAQLVIVPYVCCATLFVDELSNTERGHSGYGSTGK